MRYLVVLFIMINILPTNAQRVRFSQTDFNLPMDSVKIINEQSGDVVVAKVGSGAFDFSKITSIYDDLHSTNAKQLIVDACLDYNFHSSLNENAEVEVFSLDGTKCLSKQIQLVEGQNRIYLDLSILNNGLYFLYIKGNAEHITKFLKIKSNSNNNASVLPIYEWWEEASFTLVGYLDGYFNDTIINFKVPKSQSITNIKFAPVRREYIPVEMKINYTTGKAPCNFYDYWYNIRGSGESGLDEGINDEEIIVSSTIKLEPSSLDDMNFVDAKSICTEDHLDSCFLISEAFNVYEFKPMIKYSLDTVSKTIDLKIKYIDLYDNHPVDYRDTKFVLYYSGPYKFSDNYITPSLIIELGPSDEGSFEHRTFVHKITTNGVVYRETKKYGKSLDPLNRTMMIQIFLKSKY